VNRCPALHASAGQHECSPVYPRPRTLGRLVTHAFCGGAMISVTPSVGLLLLAPALLALGRGDIPPLGSSMAPPPPLQGTRVRAVPLSAPTATADYEPPPTPQASACNADRIHPAPTNLEIRWTNSILFSYLPSARSRNSVGIHPPTNTYRGVGLILRPLTYLCSYLSDLRLK